METEFRRKAPRRAFDGLAGALYQGNMTISSCSQLGEGGALISGQNGLSELKPGENIVLTLFLPSIGGIVATAQCVYRSENDHVGLQFHQLDMVYKKRIREFVSRRKTRLATKK